jgi:multicomponent K+:H+ antiporter subunit F
MSGLILHWALLLSEAMLACAMVCAAIRMVAGPRAQDRILGLDTLYVNGMLLLVVVGIDLGSRLFFELALIIGLLSFVTTLALAKFLLRGEVIE